jgi:hypothetical protein
MCSEYCLWEAQLGAAWQRRRNALGQSSSHTKSRMPITLHMHLIDTFQRGTREHSLQQAAYKQPETDSWGQPGIEVAWET